MADRAELLEAAFDAYPEGLALLDEAGRVVFWNRSAEIITGHPTANLIGRALPGTLEPLICCGLPEMSYTQTGSEPGRATLVHAQHPHGHDIPAFARRLVLRNSLGTQIGMAAMFHGAERSNALPHGETTDGFEVTRSQAELRDRIEAEYERFQHESAPFSAIWISVDQAESMRKTHGNGACEAMLENVERTLANSLPPGAAIGRWADDEFLVVSHEGSAQALAQHAQVLAGIARTADFRWWGDRVSLTVSIGAATAQPGEPLSDLLKRAADAMQASVHAGGNHVTVAPGRPACSPS